MQTIRSVQRSVDGGVDSNILQRNISIIEAVQIQLVRIETLFSDHESRVLYDQLQNIRIYVASKFWIMLKHKSNYV